MSEPERIAWMDVKGVQSLRRPVVARCALDVERGTMAYDSALAVTLAFQHHLPLDEWRAMPAEQRAEHLDTYGRCARHELDQWRLRARDALDAAEAEVWRGIGSLIDAGAPSAAILARADSINAERKSVLTAGMIEEIVARRMRMAMNTRRRRA